MDAKRVCRKCGVEKTLTEFYRHNDRPEGRELRCCECVRKCAANYRDANRAFVREQHRKWKKNFERRNPEKNVAQRYLENAVRRHGFVRGDVCENCGIVGKMEAHHEDYSKPLSVRWFCKKCHCNHERKQRDTLARFLASRGTAIAESKGGEG